MNLIAFISCEFVQVMQVARNIVTYYESFSFQCYHVQSCSFNYSCIHLFVIRVLLNLAVLTGNIHYTVCIAIMPYRVSLRISFEESFLSEKSLTLHADFFQNFPG